MVVGTALPLVANPAIGNGGGISLQRRLPVARQSCMRKVVLGFLACALALPADSNSSTDLLIWPGRVPLQFRKDAFSRVYENYNILGHRRPSESGTLILRKAGKNALGLSPTAGQTVHFRRKNVYLYTLGTIE